MSFTDAAIILVVSLLAILVALPRSSKKVTKEEKQILDLFVTESEFLTTEEIIHRLREVTGWMKRLPDEVVRKRIESLVTSKKLQKMVTPVTVDGKPELRIQKIEYYKAKD